MPPMNGVSRIICHRLRPALFVLATLSFHLLPITMVKAEDSAQGMGFGLIAVQAPEDIQDHWRPLLAALARRLGIPVEPHVAKDYAGTIWAMRKGTDSLVWLGNKGAIEAVDHAEGEIFARMVFMDSGAGYHSQMILRDGLPYRSAEEVLAHAADLTLGLGDTNSTSGFLVPGYYLFARHGITPRKAFLRITQASHEANILAVAEGRLDAATVASNHLDTLLRDHPDYARRLRIVWRSPEIPSDPLLWRRDLPTEVKARIRDFFLDFGNPRSGKSGQDLATERGVLARLGVVKFIASDNRQLLPIRKVELYRSRQSIEDDGTLAPQERNRRLDEINRQLAEIE